MCGICGIVTLDGSLASAAELRVMTDAMRHRGPDDEGFYCEGGVGLGMRRLSIIDLAGGHQPISNEDGTISIVFNGEIYNYVELRADLERRGHRFRTHSDTEVIVHLYEEKGREAVHDLNGMFGFCLNDGRTRATWVVRDRLGIKPLFVARTSSRVVFASDLESLRRIVRPAPSHDAFVHYLALAYVPTPLTAYEGIAKLPAGHWLWIQDGHVTTERYWAVTAFERDPADSAQGADRLTALLSDAVRIQMRSDVPVAVLLSGGIDSSAVLATAAKLTPHPVHTLTACYGGKGGDDQRFAADLARRFSTDHLELVIGPAEAARGLDDLLTRTDEPVSDSAIVPTFLLAQRAREAGIRVLLSGAGGDELFGGYSRHWELRRWSAGWLADRLPGSVRRTAGALLAMSWPHAGLRVSDPRIWWGVGVSGANLGACRDLLGGAGLASLVRAMREEYADLPATRSGTYRRMHLDLRTYLVDDVLALSDKATMAASVEGRVPLLDHRLVEFAFALKASVNLLGGEPKGLLRKVLSGVLPDALLDRRKEGFNAPMHCWMHDPKVFGLRDALLGSTAPPIRDLVSRPALEAILADERRRHEASETLFALYLYSRWWQARS